MAQFIVTFDRNTTRSGQLLVEADNEDEARKIAEQRLEGSHLDTNGNPYGLKDWEYGEHTWHSVNDVEPADQPRKFYPGQSMSTPPQ